MTQSFRYKAIIEYDGTNFSGWQLQKPLKFSDITASQNSVGESYRGLRTIQGELQLALRKYCGQDIVVFGSGRTDAGVHARGQLAHFNILRRREPNEILGALNHYLKPHPISVTYVEQVDKNFHARFSAIQRQYEYLIYNRPVSSPFAKNAWYLSQRLDAESMHEGAQYLVGYHNFTSFRSANCSATSPMRTIDFITVKRVEDYVKIEVAARSFLHNQVRIIVGNLYKVGLKKWRPEHMKIVLQAEDRSKASLTAPACGLYLVSVKTQSSD